MEVKRTKRMYSSANHEQNDTSSGSSVHSVVTTQAEKVSAEKVQSLFTSVLRAWVRHFKCLFTWRPLEKYCIFRKTSGCADVATETTQVMDIMEISVSECHFSCFLFYLLFYF